MEEKYTRKTFSEFVKDKLIQCQRFTMDKRLWSEILRKWTNLKYMEDLEVEEATRYM
jgi:hypothetical protein